MGGLWKKFIINTLFPQFCLGCNKEGELICPDCLSLIETSEFDFCPFCQKPKRVFEQGRCGRHYYGKSLNGIFSASTYQNPLLKKLIFKFKYEPFLKNLSEPLAYLIIAHFLLSENKKIKTLPENSVFVPAPLWPARKRWRGYNQSEEIAKILAEFYGIPLVADVLAKTRKTDSQTGLSLEKRMENVKNSFTIKKPEAIRDKIVYLIDDVFTTGSTMEECARVLKQAGSREVWGIAVAREMPE